MIELTEDFTGITKVGALGTLIQDLYVRAVQWADNNKFYIGYLSGGYNISFDGQSTSCIDWDAEEEEIKKELVMLGNIDDVRVIRTGDASSTHAYGYKIDVLFVGSGVVGNVPTMTIVQCKAYSPSSMDISVSVVREGFGGAANRFCLKTPKQQVHLRPASILGPTSYTGTIYKVQGHRWTIAGTSLVGDINAFGADDSSLQTEGANISVVDDFNAGDSPTTYTIPGLVEGVPYYVRTKISNALGEGSYSVSSFNTPKSVPDAPRFAVGDHAAHVDEVQLIQTAASHIDEVQILTVTADHVSEVQSIRTSAPQGSTISGTFFLKYTTANGKLVTTAMEKQVVVVRSDARLY